MGRTLLLSEPSHWSAVRKRCVSLQIAVSTGETDALAAAEKGSIVMYEFVLPSITLYI